MSESVRGFVNRGDRSGASVPLRGVLLPYLFWNALKKQWRIMRSYGFNFVLQVASLVLFFGLIYFGARVLVGPNSARFGRTIEGLLIGYWLWIGVIMSWSVFAWSVIQYAQQGLLEQLFMTPWGLRGILTLEAAASFVLDLLLNLLLLVVFMLMSGHWLRLEPVTTFLLYVATLLPGYGIGYALAGLAMRFKNIQSLFNLMQFFVIGLQAMPVDRYPWLNVFPFAQSTRMLIQHVRMGTLWWEFSWQVWAIVLAQAAGYLVFGLWVYGWLERAARERGLLAHY